MISETDRPADAARRGDTRADDVKGIVALALAVGLAHRLLAGWRAPLWFDENFTAAIATQPSFSALIHWCLQELSGPVYYVMMWSWERVAGESDTALRVPSLLCSIAAPLLLLWKGHPDRATRQLWAGLAAVWLPGLMYACEARSYALLFLLAAAQSIAFLRMMRAPSVRSAVIWSLFAALAALTHYYSLVITGLQLVAYLAFGGRRAWLSWPAALVFVPVAVWMRLHVPFLLTFAQPGVAWYPGLSISVVRLVPSILLGMNFPAAVLLGAIALTWAWQWWRHATGRAHFPQPRAEMLLVASGVGAFLIVFGMAFVRPSFMPRYLFPFMPPFLLGIALWIRGCGEHWRLVAAVLLLPMTGAAAGAMIGRIADPEHTDPRFVYNFEQPSVWLRARGVERLVVLWDNPTSVITSDHYMDQVAGFFFRREGRPVPIVVPALPRDADPNGPLVAAAAGRKTGILWAYDTAVPGTRGATHPARIAAIDPSFACRDFGAGSTTVLACIR